MLNSVATFAKTAVGYCWLANFRAVAAGLILIFVLIKLIGAIARSRAERGDVEEEVAEYTGPSKGRLTVAIAGAEMGFTLNQASQPNYSAFEVFPGDELRWGPPQNGVRSYFSVAGGFQHERAACGNGRCDFMSRQV